MKRLEIKIEDGWLWIKDRPSRFEDFIMPHQHLIHIFLSIHCRESHYFEGKALNFPLEDNLQLFPGLVKCCVCFVIVQSSLHENVVFSVCARMDNAAYIMFIIWNSISGLDAWYHFRFNISCGLSVMGRSHKKIR